MLVIKTVLWLSVGVVIFMLGLPYYILKQAGEAFSFDIGPFRWLGLLVLAAGLILFVYTMFNLVHFGRGTPSPWVAPTKNLVSSGPFGLVRNPAYMAVITILTGDAVLFQSYALIIYAMAWWLVFHIFVVVYEEPDMKARFGDSYQEYCRNVPRWMPKRSSKTRAS